MAAKYLPLRLMEYKDEYVPPFEDILGLLMEKGFPKMNEEEFITTMLKVYHGLLDSNNMRRYISIILETFGPVMQQMGLFTMDRDPRDVMTDIFDFMLKPFINNYWKRNKQVYKPDVDFCHALLKTENLILTKEMISHLPCHHFYIDVTNYDLFQPIQGIFVDIFEFEEGVSINIFLCSEDTFWSSYDYLNFKDRVQGEIKLDIFDHGEDCANYSLSSFDEIMTGRGNQYIEGKLNRNEATFFVYQLIMYLSSNEPQFEESQVTKSTYRPPKSEAAIKNKFSEIQMHDIGIRFGKSFRAQQKKYKCKTILTKHMEQKRKSPIPHFRSAHWQRYWTGKGRTIPVTKWIEPIFICGEESSDVIIHKI